LSRKQEHRIADIILCCDKILRFTRGMNQGQLAEQELVQDAVLRNIEIIGEAAKQLSDDVRARMPGIEWKKIAGMRDWLSHVYFRVDPDIVWDVVQNKVPELLRTLQAFKGEDQPSVANRLDTDRDG
jgi:uncharacterized protein with HEPN domain